MKADEIIKKALEEGRTKLLEHEALEIVKLYGASVADFGFARTPEEAGDVAEKIGYPVVVKVVSPDISHKTDVGGVVLRLKSRDEVVGAAKKIIENVSVRQPGARITGFLVQKMAPPGLEVIVGGTRDPVFGPVVMFGLGGIFVEILRDVTFRVTPVTLQDALEMMIEIRSAKLLEGYRGQPPVDKNALAKIIVAVSDMMEAHSEIVSVDLNPIMAYSSGALVVDSRVIVGRVR